MWLVFLDQESVHRAAYLKTYLVYGDTTHYNYEKRATQLENLGKELQLQNIALTFVPSFGDTASSVHLNGISQSDANTFLIYRRSNIIGKYVNLKPSQENFAKITDLLDQSNNEYFKLPRIKKE